MPLPGACTSPRRRSVSASRRSRSSSAASCSCARSRRGSPRRGPRSCGMARQIALLEHDALAELGADSAEGTRTTVPLAVNADSLATWFLEPLARLSERHPVVFELHRDDQDFTAGLLESGTVMGAVTSRSTPVAGCRVSALGAMRYEAVATPAFVRRWLPDRQARSALAQAPARRLRPPRRPADAVAAGVRDRRVAARPALRSRVERLRDGGAARARLGAAAAVPVARGAGCRRARAPRRSADRRAPVLAAVEPALAAARRDRRRDRRRGPTGAEPDAGRRSQLSVSRR